MRLAVQEPDDIHGMAMTSYLPGRRSRLFCLILSARELTCSIQPLLHGYINIQVKRPRLG
jgi:hypothetical protein